MQALQDPAPAIDWNLIQSLYVRGIGPKEIAARTGVRADTVSARASRKGWTALTARVKQALQGAMSEPSGQGEQGQAQANDKASTRVRNTIAASLEKACATLERTPAPASLKAIHAQQRAIAPLVDNAAKVFGWQDSSHSPPAVRISIMSASTLVSMDNKASFVAGVQGVAEGGRPLEAGGSSTDTSPKNFPILEVSATPVPDPDETYSI